MNAILFMHLSRAFGQACDPADCACGQVKGRHTVLLGLRLEGNTEWNSAKFTFSLSLLCPVSAVYHAASIAEMNWLFL